LTWETGSESGGARASEHLLQPILAFDNDGPRVEAA